MKKRSAEFIILAIIYGAISIAIPLQVMWQYSISITEVALILHQLTALNVLVMILGLVCAYCSYEASRAILFLAPLYVGMVCWNNFLFVIYDSNYSPMQAFVAAFFTLSIHSILVRDAPISVLKNPGLRWWRMAKRVDVNLQTLIRPATGGDFTAKTTDLSTSGLFISNDSIKWRSASGTTVPNQIHEGIHCEMKIVLGTKELVECTGLIVRTTQSNGSYPSGFGIRIVSIDTDSKLKLDQYVKDQIQYLDVNDVDTAIAA